MGALPRSNHRMAGESDTLSQLSMVHFFPRKALYLSVVACRIQLRCGRPAQGRGAKTIYEDIGTDVNPKLDQERKVLIGL